MISAETAAISHHPPWTTQIEVNMTAGQSCYFCVPRNGAAKVAVREPQVNRI